MSNLWDLHNTKWNRQKELNRYKTRKRQLEKIKSNLSSSFDDNASDLNSCYEKVKEQIRSGIQFSQGGYNGAASDWTSREFGYGDSNLSSSRSCISSEIIQVNNEISNLEGEIQSLEARICAEEDRLAREAAEKAKALIN
ncbi:MAG: hypothetical protein ACI4DZ_12550 [Oliverpabstia sp.]